MLSIKKLCGGVLVVVVFLVLSAPAHAAMYIDQVALDAADEFALDPIFQSVGYVGGYEDGGWVFIGSAVLIAPDWVLTAGHNITDIDDSGFEAMKFSLDPDIYGGDSPEYYMADATYVYPGYSPVVSSYGHGDDIGLIHLSTPVTDVDPAVLYSGDDQRGTLMYMAGYGDYGTRSSGLIDFDGVKRAGSNIAAEFGGDNVPWHRAESQYWLADFDLFYDDVQPLEWQSTPGDSGGGWFADIDGQMQLVGITHGILGLSGSGVSAAIRVSLYDEWIHETMSSVPEPGTLVLFMTGALGLLPLSRRKRITE